MPTIYFNEYNVQMGAFSYLPLVSGLLQAYGGTFPEIKENYTFMPFIYHMDEPAKILAQYTKPPDIAAFSSVMWNEQLNYHIARCIKEKYPDCLIVFGGPNVPMPPQHSIKDWMEKYPFVDVAVRAEGEEPFVDILKRLLESRDLRDIPGVASRHNGQIHFCNIERPFKRDLSEYPSPYLTGLYDDMMAQAKNGGHQYQAIIETNRGCPFPCTFCYWGKGGLSRKFQFKELDKVRAEMDWMGRNGIKYVFNADSNFGMNARDAEIADFIVETKKKYGYPEKFRTCFGKNTDDKIFSIGALFHAHNLEKGITLARQSNDGETLKNIKRNNIKMSTYINLQKRFNDQGIPVYGELILGLPGETLDSWRRGVDELLEAGTGNQLFIYLCQVFSNTEMAETEYRQRFGIQTRRIQLAEIHGGIRPPEWVPEYEDVVIATNSMPHEHWKRSLRLSYVLMLFHSLKLAYYPMIFMLDKWGVKMSQFIEYVSERKFDLVACPILVRELDCYDEIVSRMIHSGEHRGTIMPEYGDLHWDVEEASFLRVTKDVDAFYEQLTEVLQRFLGDCGVDFGDAIDQLHESVTYQRAMIPKQADESTTTVGFDYNFPEYFDKRFCSEPVALHREAQEMKIHPTQWHGDWRRFAKETILWGRKSGTMLVRHEYRNTLATPSATKTLRE